MTVKKSFKYGIFEILIAGTIGIYVDCISSGKILFIDGILSDSAKTYLLSHSFLIISILIVLNILSYFLSHYSGHKAAEKELYNRICKHIFNEAIRSEASIEDSDCKVSLMKIGKHLRFNWKAKTLKIEPYMYVFGRHQTKQGNENSRVKFHKHEGCAGIAFAMNLNINKTINVYDPNNSAMYYNECQSKLNLSEKKAKKLNEKPASCVCIPIRFFETDKVMGILSIDSINGILFDQAMVRKVESCLKNYQAIFHQS